MIIYLGLIIFILHKNEINNINDLLDYNYYKHYLFVITCPKIN